MEKHIEQLINATDLFGKVNTKIAKLPNRYILTYILEAIDSLSSNAIESIHTTIDEAYDGIVQDIETPFHQYREALKISHKNLLANELILDRDIKLINKLIRGVDGEYRKTPVTIKDSNGNIVHKPVDADKIPSEMAKLVELINGDRKKNQILNALDIHHLFEYIHPFNDGNGRTGRILFALLLAKYEILDTPASVFSYSIAKSKTLYYRALNACDEGERDEYYFLMLEMLNDSLRLTLKFIDAIVEKMNHYVIDESKKSIIAKYLFSGLKTTNRFIVKKTGFNNKTVSKYIDELINEGLITKERRNKYVAYKNVVLEKVIKDIFIEIK